MRHAGGVKSLFDARGHLSWRESDVLEPEGHFAVHRVVDGLQFGVLEDEADGPGQRPRRSRDHVLALDLRASSDAASVEMRNQAVQDTQQRRLPSA